MDGDSAVEGWDSVNEPPKLATWILNRFAPRNNALAGDLAEEFRQGRSRAWYWRQIIAAVCVGAVREIQIHPIPLISCIAMGLIFAWLFLAYVPRVVIDPGVREYYRWYYANGGSGFGALGPFFSVVSLALNVFANALAGGLAVRGYSGHRPLMAVIFAATVFCQHLILIGLLSVYVDATTSPPRYGIDLPTLNIVLMRPFAVKTVAALMGGLWAARIFSHVRADA
jgi:hypothetical protein